MPSRRGYSKKTKTYNKKRVKDSDKLVYTKNARYPNTRALAIQRMDLVPPSKLMKCVFDDTYLISTGIPGSSGKGTNTFGLCFNLNDLENGPAATITSAAEGTGPYWGDVNIPDSYNQSGESMSEPPFGFTRFIGDGSSTNTAPYRAYTVVGGKWNIRVEQVHKTGAAAPAANDLAKLVGVCSKLGREKVNTIGANEDLSKWQNTIGVQQSNMTSLVSSGTNRPSTSGNQQIRQSGTWSAKKFFDIKDIKDNLERIGGDRNEAGTYIPPEDNCYLQVGFFDRIRNGDDAGYVMPNVMVRFRYEAVVLCTSQNMSRNVQV